MTHHVEDLEGQLARIDRIRSQLECMALACRPSLPIDEALEQLLLDMRGIVTQVLPQVRAAEAATKLETKERTR